MVLRRDDEVAVGERQARGADDPVEQRDHRHAQDEVMCQSDEPQKATMAMTATMAGKARRTKAAGVEGDIETAALVSRDEPEGPAHQPARWPLPTNPTMRDTRAPKINRLSRSRPRSSVPSRWWMLGRGVDGPVVLEIRAGEGEQVGEDGQDDHQGDPPEGQPEQQARRASGRGRIGARDCSARRPTTRPWWRGRVSGRPSVRLDPLVSLQLAGVRHHHSRVTWTDEGGHEVDDELEHDVDDGDDERDALATR